VTGSLLLDVLVLATSTAPHQNGKDGLTIKEKYAYNLETLRLRHAGGDISQRKIYMLCFGTTHQPVDKVSL